MGNQNRVAVVVPFRDRGIDPLRKANLDRVLDHWRCGNFAPTVVSDGRDGDAQFNRSAAYNAGVRACPAADVFVYTESDMLIAREQIDEAVGQAVSTPGLVVPFTQYRYLGPEASTLVRADELDAANCDPDSVMDNGRSIGAINVVSL